VSAGQPSLRFAPAGKLTVEYLIGNDEKVMFPDPMSRSISVTLEAGETREVVIRDDG
jgi:hypothetical protein